LGSLKDKVYDTKHHTLEDLRNITLFEISTVSPEELQKDNMFHKLYQMRLVRRAKITVISCSTDKFYYIF
jgi:hypothetical protein